jgi:hypothetical protein
MTKEQTGRKKKLNAVMKRLLNQQMSMSSGSRIIAEDVQTNIVKNRSKSTDEEIIIA